VNVHRWTLAAAFALTCLLPTPSFAGTGKIRTAGAKRLLDFCVSVRFDATQQQLTNIERAFADANVVLADATDGQFEFGKVSIINGSMGSREADVFVLEPEGRAYATCGLYGTPGEHITFYYPSNFVANPTADGDAYTVAHEFMHHVWGVKDEYSGPGGPAECEPQPGSGDASFCLLDNYFVRGGNNSTGTGNYTLDELCVESNHDPDFDTWEETKWMQSCWERLATHPTRALTPPADLPDDAPPATTAPIFRYPSADRRFVLCLDRSSDESAQGDSRLNYEKQAANTFIDLLPEGDELAIVSFANFATVDFALTEMDSAAREAAKDAIAALVAGGTTSLGAGIEAARDLITAQGDTPCAQSIVLLTDGLGNTGIDELSLVPSLIEGEMSVISIAVGTSVSVANLQSIATDTGGRFLVLAGSADFAPLISVLSAEVIGGAANADVGGSVAEGDTVDIEVIVDTLMNDVTFVLAWPELADDLDLFLRTPSGRIITLQDALNDPDITFVDENGTEIFFIAGSAVEDGIWSAFVTGREVFDDGSFCLLTLHTLEEAVVVGAPDQPLYDITQSIMVSATPRYLGNAVAGATVVGTFTRPDGTTGPLTFTDDGAAPDDIADDGVYSALFSSFNGVTGAYSFDLQVENVDGTTFAGEGHYASVGAPVFTESAPPFIRIATTSAVVTDVNTAPVVSCPGLVELECDLGGESGGTPGVIEVGVFDANGDALTVEWRVGGVLVQTDEISGGAPPTQALVQLPWSFGDGVHGVSVTVSDGQSMHQCTATVSVADGTGPSLTALPEPAILWPPNNRLVDIDVEILLTDDCDAEPGLELRAIRSSEDPGDEEDIVGADIGSPDTAFQLRAQRDGANDGREYTITYRAVDASGNFSDHVSTVLVPHDNADPAIVASQGAFVADGTDLRPAARSYVVVAPAEAVESIEPGSVRVGNQDGTTRPIGIHLLSVVGDERPDTIFEFDAEETRELRAASPDPIGLWFLTTAGKFFGTEDIFALGEPVAIVPSTGVPGTGESGSIGLYRPIPNPFRGTSRLAYSVPAGGASVRIDVYDVQGRRIRQLRDEPQAGGVHEVVWDGRTGASRPVPSGVYFFRVAIGSDVRTMRVTLLR
jgi:uncharacterized protein YegL